MVGVIFAYVDTVFGFYVCGGFFFLFVCLFVCLFLFLLCLFCFVLFCFVLFFFLGGGGRGVGFLFCFALFWFAFFFFFLLSWMIHHDYMDTCCFECLIFMFLYFCICTCSAQLSMFHMERRFRNTLIIIIIIVNVQVTCKLCLGDRPDWPVSQVATMTQKLRTTPAI